MTRILTADEIAAALRTNPPLERLIELQRECQPARDAVRARLADIAQSQNPNVIPHGPARLAAIAKDVDAVVALDREAERLHTELAILDDLESRCVAQMESRRAADARAAAPAARRRLPGAIAAADRAMAELDRALAAITALIEPLATVASLPGEQFPLSDAEASSLLRLREDVWKTRTVPTLICTNRDTHPQAFGIAYEVRCDGYGERIIARQPPQRIYLPDLAN